MNKYAESYIRYFKAAASYVLKEDKGLPPDQAFRKALERAEAAGEKPSPELFKKIQAQHDKLHKAAFNPMATEWFHPAVGAGIGAVGGGIGNLIANAGEDDEDKRRSLLGDVALGTGIGGLAGYGAGALGRSGFEKYLADTIGSGASGVVSGMGLPEGAPVSSKELLDAVQEITRSNMSTGQANTLGTSIGNLMRQNQVEIPPGLMGR